jgi:branched-chain amino acid transport system permease protein
MVAPTDQPAVARTITWGWARWVGLALAGVFLLALPLILSPYLVAISYLVCISVCLAQSWNLIGGYTGLASLGTAAFFGTGAYTTFLLIRGLGTPFLLAALAGGLVAAALAVLVARPVFRFRGVYFTIGTLVLAEALRLWMINWELTGGAQGLNLPSRVVPDRLTLYYIALGLAAAATLLLGFILRTRLGLALRAIRDNEDAAQNMGIDTFRAKLIAFSLSAFLAGVAGGVHGVKLSVIEPYSIFAATWTIEAVNIVIIGGIGTLFGPILGAVAVTALAELLADYPAMHLIITGVVFILVIRFLPTGLWGTLRRRLGWGEGGH